jgi:hypothetical protein
MSADNSMATTPLGSGTPTGSVVIPNRDRSGTVLARPATDPRGQSPAPSDASRPDTETEDDGDVDMDRPRHSHRTSRTEPPGADVSVADAHIIINQAGGGVGDVDVAVEDDMVSLEANDDFAMGAPPGAPGAINDPPATAARRRNTIDAPDVTPRAGFVGLPDPTPTMRVTHTQATPLVQRTATIRGRNTDNLVPTPGAGPSLSNFNGRSNSHHARESDSGPYRDEDVLFGLQLLAYLSKYPHVRQAFYKPRASFHPATVNYTNARYSTTSVAPPPGSFTAREKEKTKDQPGKARGKERAPAQTPVVTAPPQIRQTNVFSLVERFTFKPSSTETELPNPPPRLPPEIQYWAGVIMRNACRKDETRGGIRQCANSKHRPLGIRSLLPNFDLSALRTLGVVSSRVRQVQKMQEGEVLRQGVPEHRVERRP